MARAGPPNTGNNWGGVRKLRNRAAFSKSRAILRRMPTGGPISPNAGCAIPPPAAKPCWRNGA
eukprot:10944453-Lingulodinium_polyedra.AAC.1